MLNKLTIGEGQTIFDIALQCYGAIEGVGLLLEDNPSIELDEPLEFGQVLLIRQDSILDINIVNNVEKPSHG